MTRSRTVAALVVATSLLTGTLSIAQSPTNEIPAEALAVLRAADDIQVFDLGAKTAQGEFLGYAIKRRPASIKNAGKRADLVKQLQQAVRESGGVGGRSFNPNYGLRATAEGKTAEFLISFEQRNGQVYLDGKKVRDIRLTDKPAKILRDALGPNDN